MPSGASTIALDLLVEELAGALVEAVGLAQALALGQPADLDRASSATRTTISRHGCISPTDGARCAAASTRSRTSAGTASGRKRRMSRRSAITR